MRDLIIYRKVVYTEQVSFRMGGNGSPGYWSCKTSHSFYHCCNNENKNSEEECLAVSFGDEICGHRSLDTSHSSACNHGGHEKRYFDTSHSSSSNRGRYVGIGRYR